MLAIHEFADTVDAFASLKSHNTSGLGTGLFAMIDDNCRNFRKVSASSGKGQAVAGSLSPMTLSEALETMCEYGRKKKADVVGCSALRPTSKLREDDEDEANSLVYKVEREIIVIHTTSKIEFA